VTGLPDERKGERLAVLYTDPTITREELWRRLSETDLPRLWLPKLENIHHVDELPVLGTGKLDLRGVRMRALELSSAPSEPRT
jgi:acyl-[acyl-carrier-protein]-phospholipid O-acyltransferase / long-chain-fatty-acid--[acyl-carrier-protein] ligase